MASSIPKKKPVNKMVFMGLVSLALYGALLLNQDIINNYIGKGGFFAFLPIATAFMFSIVHGSFTGNFWTVLGIEASRKRKEVK